MKSCTKCYKQYSDDTLNFCLDDGTPLIDLGESAENTAILQERVTEPTAVARAGWNVAPPARKSSSALWWVLGILGLSAVICGGGIAGLIYVGSRSGSGPQVTRPSPTPFVQKPAQSPAADADEKGSVTKAQFDQIDIGMQKSEVQRIMASPGEEYYRGKGGDTIFLLLRWADKNYNTILVNFENDRVTSKSQVGLDDPKK